MGAKSCKMKDQQHYHEILSEHSSYKDACQKDPFLQSFDQKLKQISSRTIYSLADGAKTRSLPLSSVKELTAFFVKTTQEVVQNILPYKLDILRNDSMYGIVNDYFDNSLLILKVCNALENFLKHVKNSHSRICVAVQQFEHARTQTVTVKNKSIYTTTLQTLESFNASGNPYLDELCCLLESVFEKQKSMLDNLRAKKRELDKDLRSPWRTIWFVFFGVTTASLLICASVVAGMTVPHVVAALATAAAGLAPMVGGWIEFLWMKYEEKLKAENKRTSHAIEENRSVVEGGDYVARVELEGIVLGVANLKTELVTVLDLADFKLRDEAHVMVAIYEVKKKLSEFLETIEHLSKHSEKCRDDVMSGRREVLTKIIQGRNK